MTPKPSQARSLLKRYISVALFAALGLLLLWFVTRGQDLEKIWKEFLGADFKWVLFSIMAGLMSHYLRALRWNLLIRSMNQPAFTSTSFHALMTGYLANLAVPRLGEITRCATLTRHTGAPFTALAGTVVAERVFDMFCLLILIFLTVIILFSFLSGFLDTYVFAPFLQMMDGRIWLLAIVALVLLSMLVGFLLYMKGISSQKNSFPARIKRQVMAFWKGILSLAVLKQKLLFVTYTVLIWFFYLMMVYLSFFALEATASLGIRGAFTILALGSLGIVAPVPGGVGTYHFIVITTLTELFGIMSESATSYAYIAHASQTLMILVVGSISWIILSAGMRKKAVVPDEQGSATLVSPD